MPNCAAYGCTNRSNEDKTLSFHKIPSKKNSKLRKQWLQIFEEQELYLKIQDFIFVLHILFIPECFQRDMMVRNFSLLIHFFSFCCLF